MTPQGALQIPSPHAPRYLVRLEMPSIPNIFKELFLLTHYLSGSRLVEVLNCKFSGRIDWRGDEDVAIAITDCDSGVRRWDSYATREYCLRLQAAGESECERCVAVDAGKGCLEHRTTDARWPRSVVLWVLKESSNGLMAIR